MLDGLSELNIAPPDLHEPESTNAWCLWWDKTGPTLNREQIEGVWGLLDRMRLVEVVELTLDQPLTPEPVP